MSFMSVSYTHLDVYKRQIILFVIIIIYVSIIRPVIAIVIIIIIVIRVGSVSVLIVPLTAPSIVPLMFVILD